MLNENTNLVSKHQLLDYVSKREFNDFVGDMRDFREVADKRFDSIEARLSAHDKRFDNIDRQFDELKELMRVQTGAILDQFRSDLRAATEFFDNIDKKKVDQREFDLLKEKVDDHILQSEKI